MADQTTASAAHRVLLCLAVILIVPVAYAGDEDMSPSAYQKFDPVTGYMIPEDDPSAQPQGHAAPGDAEAGSAANAGGEGSASSTPSPMWGYLLFAAALIAALLAWASKKRKARRSP
jgi:hypothetical protein